MTLFCSFDNEGIAVAIRKARCRVILCTPGFTDSVAAALIAQSRSLGRNNVRVVVDATDVAARSGYGYFDAVKQAHDEGVDIRKEPGLRLSVLIVDDEGWCFALPPLLVEDVAERAVAPNAVRLSAMQTQELAESIVPPTPANPIPNATEPVGEIGKRPLQASDVVATVRLLEENPPQKFDLARKVLIFNAYIEFVEIELNGIQIDKRRVQLPQELILAASDEATRRRLRASFDLIQDTSVLKLEADTLRRKVDEVRNKMARSAGKRYGSIVLRVHKDALDRRIAELKVEVERFKKHVLERVDKELQSSRAQLIKNLIPVIKKNPPQELTFGASGRLTNELVGRFLERKLSAIFPKPEKLVEEMELTCNFKGVTYQTLNEPEFQEAVRKAFPDEDFDKPFEESIGVKATTGARAAPAGSSGNLL